VAVGLFLIRMPTANFATTTTTTNCNRSDRQPTGRKAGRLLSENEFACFGDTPLIAAMRCYVASKLGDEVEVPAELI
jgi:hypothetical protein